MQETKLFPVINLAWKPHIVFWGIHYVNTIIQPCVKIFYLSVLHLKIQIIIKIMEDKHGKFSHVLHSNCYELWRVSCVSNMNYPMVQFCNSKMQCCFTRQKNTNSTTQPT